MPFQVYQNIFFGEIISRKGVNPDPRKLLALTEISHLIIKRIAIILGIIHHLDNFSPLIAEVC